ncbi:hypothetical protein UCDDA912_g03380 [Diaporthe ampelina]|uniref:Uncharacterized protein n=1 Tax=Diaporthe ampelina TaxID=1214573 RepID=A0A0G2FQW8_9PEZI|nr:hypothetical protein UCDDA912_g03380 [Diaporthe ampelina]
MAPHSNPSRAQRETDALQRVVARTSDGLLDVYHTTPGAYPRHKPGGVRDRKAQYQFVLTKVDSDDSLSAGDGSLSTDEEDDAPVQGNLTRIKADPRRKLVGSFREAAAAMA